jgi:hypothetical protein
MGVWPPGTAARPRAFTANETLRRAPTTLIGTLRSVD